MCFASRSRALALAVGVDAAEVAGFAAFHDPFPCPVVDADVCRAGPVRVLVAALVLAACVAFFVVLADAVKAGGFVGNEDYSRKGRNGVIHITS